MSDLATADADASLAEARMPGLTGETRDRIGRALREAYVERCDARPITDVQVDLLLRLRQKERDRRRGA